MTRSKWLSLALCLAVLLLVVPAFAGGPANNNGGAREPQAFSAVAMHPVAVEHYKALGKPIHAPVRTTASKGRKFAPGGEVLPQLTTAATQKILVLFVSFQDDPPGGPVQADRFPLSYFDDMLFGTVYNPPEYAGYGPTDRTLKNFYLQNSYNAVTVTTEPDNMPTVLGWVKLPHDYAYYCPPDDYYNGTGFYPHNVPSMVKDAVLLVDDKVDFSKYAINGEVPNLFVVHTGSGAEWTGDPRLIWSHSWSLSGGADGPVTVDGVVVDSYATMPEVGGDTTHILGVPSYYGPFPPTVGVYAHEYGHVLGLPDQYDYGYESEGTGPFSLMAGGSWNQYPFDYIFSGNSPSNLDAWSKYRLGFVTPTDVTTASSLTLRPAENYPDIVRMMVPNSGGKEYFLFENRQHTGFDKGLRYSGANTHGLAIYHIDEVVLSGPDYWRPNEAENWREFRSLGWQKAWTGETHYGISLIQADDFWELEHGYRVTNRPYSGDLYPGYWNVHSFGSFTSPNSSTYYFWGGSTAKFGFSGVSVFNIAEGTLEGVDCGTVNCITADFSYIPWAPPSGK